MSGIAMDIESTKNEEKPEEIHESVSCNLNGAICFVFGLLTGTFSALVCKMAYDTKSIGLDGSTKAFAKPIMMLLLMFTGMVPAIIFWLVQQSCRAVEDREVVSYRTMTILIVPSICDLLCTLLLLVAQLYITASLWQMMRGSIIIITALMKRGVLGHRLKKHMWLGVAVITIAMMLVASTSFFGGDSVESGAKDPRVGILLVLVGCVAQGVQYVFEEKVMAVDNAPPLVVIGCEGMWGAALTLLLVYPLSYLLPGDDNGRFEDPFDAVAMIQNSPSLQTLVVLFLIFVTGYNCMAVYVTKYLSAIWHAILDNFRPITIWGMDLLIFYVLLPNTGFGEAWTSASWLQLAGLLTLFLGTAIYNGSVLLFDDAQQDGADPAAGKGQGQGQGESQALVQKSGGAAAAAAAALGHEGPGGIIRTAPHMSSPYLARSPLIHHQQGRVGAAAESSRSGAVSKSKYSSLEM